MKTRNHIPITIAVLFGSIAPSDAGPKFNEYPIAISDPRIRPTLRLDTAQARSVSKILEQAYKKPVNFSGHYVWVSWNTGADCDAGAAIDVNTGRVTFLDSLACGWRLDNKVPFYTNTGSRLLVLSGRMNGSGTHGAHYFLLEAGKFVPIQKQDGEMEIDQATGWYLGKQGMSDLEAMSGNERKQYISRIKPLAHANDIINLDVPMKGDGSRLDLEPFNFTVCNKHKTKIIIAITSRSNLNSGSFRTAGWTSVERGQCRLIGTYPKGDFYYAAVTDDNKYTSGNGPQMCVSGTGSFLREYTVNSRCAENEYVLRFNQVFVVSNNLAINVP